MRESKTKKMRIENERGGEEVSDSERGILRQEERHGER